MSRKMQRAPGHGRLPGRFLRPGSVGAACFLALGLTVAAPWISDRLGASFAQGAGEQNASSGPIAITGDDQFVWSVNPEVNTLTAVRVANDANQAVRVLRTD